MEKLRPIFSRGYLFGQVLVVAVVVLLHSRRCMGVDSCPPSSCGNIRDIRSPFRLIGDPENCGDHRFNLSCENKLAVLYLSSRRSKYYVQEINYTLATIRLLDPGIQKDKCSSIPLNTITIYDDLEPYKYTYLSLEDDTDVELVKPIVYLKCANPVSSPLYVDAAPCLNDTNTSSSAIDRYYYVYIGSLKFSEWRGTCRIEQMSLLASKGIHDEDINYLSYEDVHNQLVYGFQLSWLQALATPHKPYCYQYSSNQAQCVSCMSYLKRSLNAIGSFQNNFWLLVILLTLVFIGLCIIIARNLLIIPFITVILIYKWRRRHLSMYGTIEEFLQRNNNLMPIRYSYSDIKKMSRGFNKDRLGEGGYATVFKGQLRSGRFVAVKMLEKPKANGQDFISEVSTLGRIHHANVVRLIGFCVEGSKRVLVYEFMPNGSLDNYIFPKEECVILSHEKMFDISLGVAHGIEYLHQGCNMQILHFDIKPHNILLDENFHPKISDFGLAKLYPLDNSIVTLTAARGTLGYIAPELLYKNIGGVSHKADVYSFGMLLMEMASRRKNLNVVAEHSSQIYFPSWVYDQFNEGKELEIGFSTEDEIKMIKKMVIVALWCIQLKPSDRPSMHEVVKMLEGGDECLQMPPKPLVCPQDEPPPTIGDDGDKSNSMSLISSSSHG